MDFPMNFIAATAEYSTRTEHVPAPYFRKSFVLEALPQKAEMLICGLGFYELFINGKRITKEYLAPYISNPDDIIYYDLYDLKDELVIGENVIGVCLGNGMQNCLGGYPWGFDKAKWRGAPQMALRLDAFYGDDEIFSIESDESFLTSPSPIWFDDLRCGEYYDARREQRGWCLSGFDDSGWKPAIKAPMPRGEARLCEAEPIVVINKLKPVSVAQQGDGFLYDFGVNCAGLCRLSINGTSGQEINMYFGECLKDGVFSRQTVCCFYDENDIIQKDIYICKGVGTETYTPSFTFHGFQYVFVKGLTEQQTTEDALTYLVMNSDLKEKGGFVCSDETVNKLQEITRRSSLANFYYFPMDCPHREKNGWTADAALSAEHMLLNLSVEKSFREWLHNIRGAQNDKGSIPGVVPTAGYGFEWGNGPAWDCVLIWLPYYTYLYRGDKAILKENAHAILRYLEFLTTIIREDGLIKYGLGDWCQVNQECGHYSSPVYFTDTIVSMDICEKSAYIFGELDMPVHKDFALSLYKRLKKSAREKLIDFNTMTAEGCCQTSQAMGIYYNLFEEDEKERAFNVLLELVQKADDHFDVGVLGARCLFHVLADFGYTDLALKMITQPTFPSYGLLIKQGATSLWEGFLKDANYVSCSLNHHFWGDISHFFIRHLAGINYNPHRQGNELDIYPKFTEALDFAEGFHIAPEGEIRVRWQREGSNIILDITVPKGLAGYIKLEKSYEFDDGKIKKPLATGKYKILVMANCKLK